MSHPKKNGLSADLGQVLKELRKRSGLTQEQAAERIGIPRTWLSSIEIGRRRIQVEELVALAQIYNVSVLDLLKPPRPQPPFPGNEA